MGEIETEEVEKFEEVLIKTKNSVEKFHEIVNFLRDRGFHGEPRFFASPKRRFFEAEFEKKLDDAFSQSITTIIIKGEERMSAGEIEVMLSKKTRIKVEFSGPFGEALSRYITKRFNLLKIRKDDKEFKEIINFLRGLNEVQGNGS